MTEFINRERPVLVDEVDACAIPAMPERKLVLAMQATKAKDTPAFAAANELLLACVEETGQAPTLTYEDLIFTNTSSDTAYVMSADEGVAAGELCFYTVHKGIEDRLAEVIVALAGDEAADAQTLLHETTTRFGQLYKHMSRTAFDAFRPYFVGINDHPGPSGLFTAAIPTIDLMTHGGANISEHETQRMLADALRGLYPSHQTDTLVELLQSSDSRVDMPGHTRLEITALLNRFRQAHGSAVRRYVPEALDGLADGSGGIADVKGYLDSKKIEPEGESND